MNKKPLKESGTGNQPHAGLPSEILLSRKQLADRWGCCLHTIARNHHLEAVRLSRRLLRYRLSDVEAIEAAAKGRAV
jgi:hypothetical protein